MISVVDKYLTGQVKEEIISGSNESYRTQVNYSALVDQPVKDLRSFGKLVFNNCGNLVQVEESSLGGTYPLKDANKVFELSIQKCLL